MVSWLVSLLVGWSAGRLVSWLVGRFVALLVSWSVGLFVGRSVGRMVGPLPQLLVGSVCQAIFVSFCFFFCIHGPGKKIICKNNYILLLGVMVSLMFDIVQAFRRFVIFNFWLSGLLFL